MSKMQTVLETYRSAAEPVAARGADAARSVVDHMRRGAQDLTNRVQSRARDEIDRRRATAATTLESLASALRPDGSDRRRKLAIVGGSSLALTAALGMGVALGFVLSRQLKARAERRTEIAAAAPAPRETFEEAPLYNGAGHKDQASTIPTATGLL
jgi:hypothetical protein